MLPRYTCRMLDITPQLRRELRAKAHHLHPVVSVGQHGLSPTVLHEIDVALSAHGLIKVRVFSEDRDERDRMLVAIAEALEASPVQHLAGGCVLAACGATGVPAVASSLPALDAPCSDGLAAGSGSYASPSLSTDPPPPRTPLRW